MLGVQYLAVWHPPHIRNLTPSAACMLLPALGAGGGHHSRALAVEDTRAVHPSIYCLVGKRIKSVPLP